MWVFLGRLVLTKLNCYRRVRIEEECMVYLILEAKIARRETEMGRQMLVLFMGWSSWDGCRLRETPGKMMTQDPVGEEL